MPQKVLSQRNHFSTKTFVFTSHDKKLAKGESLLLKGELDKAERCYRKILKEDLLHSGAWAGLGCTFLARGELPKAYDIFAKALEKDASKGTEALFRSAFRWVNYGLPKIAFAAYTGETPILKAPEPFIDELSQYAEASKDYPHWLHQGGEEHVHNVKEAQKIFKIIHEKIDDPRLKRIVAEEIVTKVLAFSELKKGMKILLPSADKEMAVYKVDTVFKLHGGIPAYGLIPENKKYPPKLIFRGMAPALSQKGGVYSVQVGVDPQGIAQEVFRHDSYQEVRKWIEKVAPVQVSGYSEGAVLAALTVTEMYKYICRDPLYLSMAFNSPGIDALTFKKWCRIPEELRPLLEQYLVKGDPISRFGSKWIGEVFEIDSPKELALTELTAHFFLALATPGWKIFPVDIEKDHHAILRQVATTILQSEKWKDLYKIINEQLSFLKWINEHVTSDPGVVSALSKAAKAARVIAENTSLSIENHHGKAGIGIRVTFKD